MNALNAKALAVVRQKVRKQLREAEFAKDVEAYKEDSDAFMQEEVAPEPVAPRKQRSDGATLGTSTAGADDLEGFEVVGPGGKTLAYTAESILKNLRSVAESRGRKGTDRLEQIRIMEKLLEVASTDYQRIRVLISMISARFDTSSSTSGAISVEQWKAAHLEFVQLIDLLHKNKDQLVIIEVSSCS